MKEETKTLIKMALAEDIGSGDITSNTFVQPERQSKARIVTREPIIVAGLSTVSEIFHQIDPNVVVTLCTQNGTLLSQGNTLLKLEGPTRSLLLGERVTLNFLGKLTGIATLTHTYVKEVKGTGVTILDTRKMTPGWRVLEKEAVRAGGGKNHRQGLFDAMMVKDNHLASLAKSEYATLPSMIAQARKDHPDVKIELEADTLEQTKFFLSISEVDTILLDNMSLEQMRQAVAIRNEMAPSIRLEASGGITLDNLRSVAETGIDEISLGALTHKATWADLSMELL